MSARPLRVLYATHASNLTGASQSLLDLLGGLDRTRVEPTVLLRQHGPIEAKLEELSVPYAFVSYLTCFESHGPVKTLTKRLIGTVLQRGVNRYVREGGFDIVHNNSLLADAAMAAARWAGVPYVAHVREMVREDHGLELLDEVRTRGLLEDAAHVVFISGFVASKFRSWAGGAPSTVLHDAVDPHRFRLDHGRLFASETARLLLAGRIAPGKGQLEAIRAAELLHDRGVGAELVIVGGAGDREYAERCRAYVQERDLGNVRFVDFSDDLTGLRSWCDIALTCSTNEAMGRVTIEGMLAGCLAVGARAGATPELIEHGATGLLYEPGDPASLADWVQWALGHRHKAERMAREAQRRAVALFDAGAYSESIMRIYETVLR